MRPWLRDTLAALGLALAALLFWQLRIIASAEKLTFIGADYFTYVYPMFHHASRSLLEGTIPLWNPYQACGHPFLATVLVGVFYPPNAFHLLLPTELAIECVVVLHLFLAGLFMYLYGRTIELSRPAALAAGLTFGLSGFVVSQANWFVPALATCVWLPLQFLAVERIFARRRLAGAVLLGVAVGMPILSGWLQLWVYSMYALGAYAGVRWIAMALAPQQRSASVHVAALLAAGVALGLCLGGVQLLPGYELQSLGPRRPGGLSVLQTLVGGAPLPATFLEEAVATDPGRPRAIFLGMLALVLMPLSLFAPRGRLRVACLWSIALLSIGVALTIHTPLFAAFRWLPAASWFRNPQRILFLYAFAGAALVGIGAEVLASRAALARPRRRVAIGATATLVVCGWLWAAVVPAPGIALLALGLACVWAALLVPRPLVVGAILAVLLGGIGWDAFRTARGDSYRPYHDVGAFRRTRIFEPIERDRGHGRTHINLRSANPWFVYKQATLRRIDSISDYEPLSLERQAEFFRLLGGDVPEPDASRVFTGGLVVDPRKLNFRLLDVLSVRYMLTDVHWRHALERAGWKHVRGPGRGTVVLYRNPAPLPRAYLAQRSISVAGGAEALQVLADPHFDPHTQLVIEGPEPREPAASRAAAPPIEPASIRTHRSDRVVIDVNARQAGYLVLTDTFYPGWKATVDGETRPILRANHLFRAVPVDAGAQTVTFRYEPLSFRIGAALSLVATASVLAFCSVAAYRRRRARRTRSQLRPRVEPR